jgi:uncharacterized membrane protein YidH (DUF202 family)
MTQETHPIADLTQEDLDVMLKRALRNTLILGLISSLAVLIGTEWRNAVMLLTGALISASSILAWQRMVRVINARLDQQKTATRAYAVVLFFLFKLILFAGVIYGSLKYIQGSVWALLYGLGLAVLTIGWEGVALLRD